MYFLIIIFITATPDSINQQADIAQFWHKEECRLEGELRTLRYGKTRWFCIDDYGDKVYEHD